MFWRNRHLKRVAIMRDKGVDLRLMRLIVKADPRLQLGEILINADGSPWPESLFACPGSTPVSVNK